MQTPRQSIGILGENIACTYLLQKGYSIIERNFQNTKGYKYGEIDIIAQHENKIIFVEVKTRKASTKSSTLPEENISPTKVRNLEKIATTYIQIHNLWNVAYRFDALAIVIHIDTKVAKVKHIEDIFF